jgi:hypothetical protein
MRNRALFRIPEQNLPQPERGTSNRGSVYHTGKPAMPGPGPSA